MLDLKIDFKGSEKYRQMLDAAPGLVAGSLPNLAMHAGQDVVDYAQHLFRLPKSGQKRVSKDGTGRIMVGSAPGEAPAIDTAKLDTSLRAEVRGFTVTVNKTDPTPYAAMLEEPPDMSKARPFMKPAHDYAAERYYANVLHLLQGVI